MTVVYLLASSNTLIPLEVVQLQNTLLNMITSSQEYFLGQNRLFYYAVSDDILLILENTQLNQQIIDSYSIHYDSTRLFGLKFITRGGGATELSIQQVLHALGNSLSIIDLNQINGLLYTTSNFSRGAVLHGNDFDTDEILVFHSNNKIKSSNKTITSLLDTNTEQTIIAPKTFASHVGLTFISTPAGTDTNNLLTRNQTNGRIQQSSITNDKLVLLDTEQTITAPKSLSSHLQLTNITTPAGTDTNNLLTRNQTNGRIQQSSITNDKLVLTDTEQSISGLKTFTGNVKLQNLPQATGTVSKVLVKNPTTNQIEEATTSNVIGSTSTASAITMDSIRTNNYTLGYEDFATIPALNGLGQSLPQNTYSIMTFQYASNGGIAGGSLPLQQSGTKIELADVGLYKFEFSFSFLRDPPTFTLTKSSGDFLIELYIDNTLIDRQIKYIEAEDFRTQTVVLYYRNLSNAVPKLADVRMFHNTTATTQAQGDADTLTFPLLSRALTVLSVISYGMETKAIDIVNDTTNTNTLLLTKADGSIVKNNNLTPTTIALKSEIPAVPNLSDYATLNTNQTITGVKTFTATTKIENLYCNGLFASQNLTHSGTASWTGRYLTWTVSVMILPINQPELGSGGHINLTLPAVGQNYTVYNASNNGAATTVAMTANGFDFSIGTNNIWSALYYKINIGQSPEQVNTNFILVSYENQAWEPDTTWVLLAVANAQNNTLKWVPGMAVIPPGASYDGNYGQLTKSIYARWMSGNVSIAPNTWTDAVFNGSFIDNSNVNSSLMPISTTDGITFTNNSPGSRQYLVTWNVYIGTGGTTNYTRLLLPNGNQIGINNIVRDVCSSSALINLAANSGFKIQVFQNNSSATVIAGGVNASAIQIHCLN